MSDIGFEDYMSLYKTCIARPYFFLVIDTTLASDNLLYFRRNLLEKLIMVTDNKITDKKLQYNIIRETVKISALLSG